MDHAADDFVPEYRLVLAEDNEELHPVESELNPKSDEEELEICHTDCREYLFLCGTYLFFVLCFVGALSPVCAQCKDAPFVPLFLFLFTLLLWCHFWRLATKVITSEDNFLDGSR